jgi:ABC-type sugar transport system ATPase subunit
MQGTATPEAQEGGMTPAHLVLDGVSVVLGGSLVLDQLSLTVAEREFVGIIGVSGGGKTTLLRTIAGLLPTTAGSVTLGGAPLLGPSPRHVDRRSAMALR